jgi:hypothetical protein
MLNLLSPLASLGLQSKVLVILGWTTLFFILGFWRGCSYEKKETDRVKAEFHEYKRYQEGVIKHLGKVNEQTAESITSEYNQRIEELAEQHGKLLEEAKQLRVALDRTRLANRTVRVFNESTGSSKPAEPVAKPEVGSNEAVNGEAERPSTLTCGDLFETAVANNIRHQACVIQVEQWQSFYNELYNNLEEVKE